VVPNGTKIGYSTFDGIYRPQQQRWLPNGGALLIRRVGYP
jgi:hypothetical protein